MSATLTRELESFQNIWDGGYFEGDPLDPMARSAYRRLSYMSVLHATYLVCIKPHINSETTALEIGPGRGAWTKALLPSKHVVALDAKPAADNGFHDYVGHHAHVDYHQVDDFLCTILPENHFSYMFSFGCLCHAPFEGITEYAKNIFPKMKPGSHCYWLVADYEKYNQAIRKIDDLCIFQNVIPPKQRYEPMRWMLKKMLTGRASNEDLRNLDEDQETKPGRWFHAGIRETCEMLEATGYRIIEEDVGVIHRDPIIHFMKD